MKILLLCQPHNNIIWERAISKTSDPCLQTKYYIIIMQSKKHWNTTLAWKMFLDIACEGVIWNLSYAKQLHSLLIFDNNKYIYLRNFKGILIYSIFRRMSMYIPYVYCDKGIFFQEVLYYLTQYTVHIHTFVESNQHPSYLNYATCPCGWNIRINCSMMLVKRYTITHWSLWC